MKSEAESILGFGVTEAESTVGIDEVIEALENWTETMRLERRMRRGEYYNPQHSD